MINVFGLIRYKPHSVDLGYLPNCPLRPKVSGKSSQLMSQKGQILVVVFIALGVVLFTVLSVVAGAQIYFQNAVYSQDAEKATALAEAGVDKAITSLNKTGGAYLGEAETVLGEGSYSVTVTSKDVATKIIEATGYIPQKSSPKVKRTVKITASRGVGAAFNYGIQVGEGGLELGNSNIVRGSIYSNGTIIAGNNNEITGDAWVAGGPQPNADQQTDCTNSNCIDYIFGKSVSGEARMDVAQSFKPTINEVLNKISLKIKKVGIPADATVRILSDSSGKPNKNGVLTTGTLYTSLVTGNYGWIEVAFSTLPTLTADTTYWLMISTVSNTNNYWIWQNDLAQSYTGGVPKWSADWRTGNPTWTTINGDLSFKTYLGGAPTVIRGGSNKLEVSGNVHANTIENLEIEGNAYYQTIINSEVDGTSYPNSADPPPKVFPISDANTADWKQQAQVGGVLSGDITNCVSVLNSQKIVGNVTFGSGCRITVKSPIWITGNLSLNSNNILILDSSYQETSGVIVVDGKVTLNSNNHLNGTGVGSSLLMVLTTYDSRQNNEDAIAVNSNGNTGVYYASRGIVAPGTGNSFKELTAWKIRLINSSTIDYETGLSSTLFSSGPSGTYTLVKGTYQVR